MATELLTLRAGEGKELKSSVSQMKHMFDSGNRRSILETIFLNPEKEFHLRGLAEEAGVSPSTASRMVEELESEGLVEVEKDLKMEISASDTERFRDFKRSFNLWKLAESGLVDEIEDEAVPEAVVLFGSYARGEDTGDSDIDIAVVNAREIDFEFSGHEEELGRRLNIHSVDLEEAEPGFVETLSNGVVLRGYLEI